MNKKAIYVLVSFCVIVFFYAIYLHIKTLAYPKIGIVHMEKYVYEFEGMKEASSVYLDKVNGWNTKADSMKIELKNIYLEIQMDSLSNNKEKLQTDIQRFNLLMNSFNEFKQSMDDKAKEDDERMTAGILNQLNEYLRAYAQKEGYDIIISNTEVNNVGYVKEGMDITKEVLDFANAQYNNE